MYEILKPFIYYVCSFTYNNIKFVPDHILLIKQIIYSCNDERNELEHKFKTYKNNDFSVIESIQEFNKNFLKNYEEIVNKNYFFTNSKHELYMHIKTIYYCNDNDDMIYVGQKLEEIGEEVRSFLRSTRTSSQSLNEEENEEEEETEELPNPSPLVLVVQRIHNFTGPGMLEKQILNVGKCFKSDECVICLTNPSNVLFCNCGDIAICTECDKVKSLNNCPVCKTENTIKRTIEY